MGGNRDSYFSALLIVSRAGEGNVNAAGHLVMGVGLAMGFNYARPYLPWEATAIILGAACGAVGALLPDIDHPNATASQKLGVARGSGPLGVFGWLGGIFRAMLGGHRGFTHTLVCALLIGAALWQWTPLHLFPYAMAFFIGWCSHLIADMLTEQGVPLFWPLITRRIGLWR